MAVLTRDELAQLFRSSETERGPISHTKTELAAAFQAIEDYIAGSRTARPARSVDAQIELAAPGTFTAGQIAALVKHYCRFRGR